MHAIFCASFMPALRSTLFLHDVSAERLVMQAPPRGFASPSCSPSSCATCAWTALCRNVTPAQIQQVQARITVPGFGGGGLCQQISMNSHTIIIHKYSGRSRRDQSDRYVVRPFSSQRASMPERLVEFCQPKPWVSKCWKDIIRLPANEKLGLLMSPAWRPRLTQTSRATGLSEADRVAHALMINQLRCKTNRTMGFAPLADVGHRAARSIVPHTAAGYAPLAAGRRGARPTSPPERIQGLSWWAEWLLHDKASQRPPALRPLALDVRCSGKPFDQASCAPPRGLARGLDVCCPRSCGACGGEGCERLPGGPGRCCATNVHQSGRSCTTEPAPCYKPGLWKRGVGRTLDGTLPTELGLLQGLHTVRISGCDTISGTLPTQLAELRGLSDLELTRTRVSGTLPSALTSLCEPSCAAAINEPTERARCLRLVHNPRRTACDFFSGGLAISGNRLSGTLPQSARWGIGRGRLSVAEASISGASCRPPPTWPHECVAEARVSRSHLSVEIAPRAHSRPPGRATVSPPRSPRPAPVYTCTPSTLHGHGGHGVCGSP